MTREPERVFRPADVGLRLAENVVYAAVGVLLAAASAAVLVAVAYQLVDDLSDGTESAVTAALDGLLLVFILIELLAGVRATMRERTLVAEPFLLVGIIASIKEILVVTIEAKRGQGEAFDDAMVEIGVLGGLILLLATATFLIRRKEREPAEG